MRFLRRIVIHCTATPRSATVDSILNYWKNHKKWNSPGYHFLIDGKAQTHNLLPIEQIANGAKYYNHDSIHISYIGGIDNHGQPKDTRTEEQKEALITVVADIMASHPNLEIVGHRDLPKVKKDCPCFDVKSWIFSVFHN